MRALNPYLIATALIFWGLVGGCSSDDDDDGAGASGAASSSGAGATGTGGSGGDGDPTPEESCRKPGDKGNNLGVGEYCTKGGDECDGFPEAALCLASVGQDQWFCTQIGCTATSDCGDDAGCIITGSGSACVPCECDDSSPQCQTGAGGSGTGGSGGTGGTATGGAGGTGGTG